MEADAVRPVAIGTVLWALALVVLLLLRDRLAVHDAQWWLWSCLVGVVLGLLGLWITLRRRARLAQDATPTAGPPSTEPPG